MDAGGYKPSKYSQNPRHRNIDGILFILHGALRPLNEIYCNKFVMVPEDVPDVKCNGLFALHNVFRDADISWQD